MRPTAQLTPEEWSTMEKDIIKAHEIIMRHSTSEETHQKIYLQEATIWLEGSMEVKRAAWVIELAEIFEIQYGKNKGNEILCRVLTALLTHGETIH